MEILVKLEAFDGPLDLLLYLIERNKIDIFDIPIAEITSQYIDMVSHIEEKDMDVMSHFLLMASTLLYIKSKMLLPAEAEENGVKEDPRAELVRRLLEYKTYKYASFALKDLQADASKMLFKDPTIPEEITNIREEVDISALLGNVTLEKLRNIFQDIMRRKVDKADPIRSKFGKIEREPVSLQNRIHDVKQYAKKHSKFNFRALLEGQESKIMVIVSFLSILELMKEGTLRIVQENICDDIWIIYNERKSEK